MENQVEKHKTKFSCEKHWAKRAVVNGVGDANVHRCVYQKLIEMIADRSQEHTHAATAAG